MHIAHYKKNWENTAHAKISAAMHWQLIIITRQDKINLVTLVQMSVDHNKSLKYAISQTVDDLN